jgi:hypothetical protein
MCTYRVSKTVAPITNVSLDMHAFYDSDLTVSRLANNARLIAMPTEI